MTCCLLSTNYPHMNSMQTNTHTHTLISALVCLPFASAYLRYNSVQHKYISVFIAPVSSDEFWVHRIPSIWSFEFTSCLNSHYWAMRCPDARLNIKRSNQSQPSKRISSLENPSRSRDTIKTNLVKAESYLDL